MSFRRLLPLLALLVLGSFVTLGFAKKGGVPAGGGDKGNYISTVATVEDQAVGVSGDGSTYVDGVGGVQCYISVSKNDADLVTYNTGRTLHFAFPANDPAVAAAGLPSSLDAEADFFAINYYGNYDSMGVGTTAQVQMDLEFKVGRLTYELDYSALAVYRYNEDTWLITSDYDDPEIGGHPFVWSDQAKLNVIRRRRQTTYGVVSMPIRIWMTRK